MNIIKTFFISGLLILFLSVGNIAIAGGSESGMQQLIGNTVAHLEAAAQALDANEAEKAHAHLKAAGQSSKNIIGGSLEVKTQRGSRAISNARRQIREGDSSGAAVSMKEAAEIFKSLLRSGESGGRGGLN